MKHKGLVQLSQLGGKFFDTGLKTPMVSTASQQILTMGCHTIGHYKYVGVVVFGNVNFNFSNIIATIVVIAVTIWLCLLLGHM